MQAKFRRVMTSFVLIMISFFTTQALGQATVTSNKNDYAPLSQAQFTGWGFQPFETVVLKVKNLNQPCNTVSADSSYMPWQVSANAYGEFSTPWTVCNCPGDSLRLKATGLTSGFIAYAYFKDAATQTRDYNYPSSFSPFTGGASICSGNPANTITANWNNSVCTVEDNGGDVNIPIIIRWYENSINQNTGGTLVKEVLGFNATKVSDFYTPANTPTGTKYYYVIVSWSATGCVSAGSITSETRSFTINPNPTTYDVTYSGVLCGTLSAIINVSGSQSGFLYDLIKNNSVVETFTGTGNPFSFTTAISSPSEYFVKARNTATGCFTNFNTVNVTGNQPPDQRTVTATDGGLYCSGDPGGVEIFVQNSQNNVNYFLYFNTDFTTPIAGPVAGTNGTISLGFHTNLGTYTIVARRSSPPYCETVMTTTVTVGYKVFSVAPTSATSSHPSICSNAGGTLSLTASGGTLGTDAVVQWFTSSCGGTSIGTGNPLVISKPTSTTTYYARYSGDCNTTGCSSVTVTVSSSVTFYEDVDGDGYGKTNVTATGCIAPSGYVSVGGDCNDGNNLIHPGAIDDPCNNIDENCDGIIATDATPPSLSGSLPGGAQGNVCLSAAPTAPSNASIAAQYTDNCSAVTATLILASSGVTGNNTSWTATYTYSIVDASGNAAANAVVVYTGGDTQAPSLSGSLPGGAQGNVCLSAAPTAPANATIAALYTDNCSAVTATLILASSGVTGNNTSWTATYTYSIVDASGNAAANAVVVYTGGDTQAPSLSGSLPGGAQGNVCLSAAPTAPSNATIAALYTDNCSAVTATLILASSGVTGNNTSWTATYTYSIVDASGNAAANAVVVYTGGDTQAPSLSGSLPGGAQGNVCLSAAPTAPANATIAALYTDNCSAVTATLILASSGVTGNNTSWTATYTYSIVDASGNAAANAVVVYTGGDTQAPSLSGSLPGGAQGNVCLSAAPTAPANATIAAQYTDNCSAVTATLILASSGVTGNNTSWTATYTYSIVDASGNAAANAVVVYTGGDTQAPSLSGSLPGGAQGNVCLSAAPTAPSNASIAAQYTDNCSAVTATLILASSGVTGNNTSWTATYTYSIVDASGNAAANAVVVYTGGDTQAPSLSGSLPGGAQGNVCLSAAPTAPSNASIAAQYTDNCSAVTATLILASSGVTGNNTSWTATYTYSIVDASGNAAANAVVVYTGGDTQAPSLSGSLPGGAQGNVCLSAAPTAPSNASIAAQYTDNCSAVTATLILASSGVTGNNTSWTATYTYSIVDASGNAAANAVVVYTGGDTQAPSLSGSLPGGAQGNVCLSAAPTAPANATIAALYTDNCSAVTATLILASSGVTGNNTSWTATYTYSIVDASGNAAANAVVVYTGGDTQAPSLSGSLPGGAQGNVCLSAAPTAPANATIAALYTDNCSAVTATLIPASSGVTGNNTSWTATYTYSIVDASGNAAANAVVVYTGGDTQAPSLSGSLPGGAQGNVCLSAAPTAPSNATIAALYTDNCSAVTATLILASSGVTGNNTSWTATYTYSIVDASGNAAANAVVVYTGGDTQAPSLSGSLPGGAQGNVCLSAAPTAPSNASIAAQYTDNCSAVTATLILASSGVTGNNTSWTATYTYSIVDASGNAAANAVVVYTGGDTQAPSLSGSLPGGAQGNVCLSAAPTAPANATIAALYTDNCSAVTATLIPASSGVTGNNTSWTATYTYSIVDASGNAAANAVVVYTGGDTQAPSLSGSLPGGAQGNVCLSAAPTAPSNASIAAQYTDNCSAVTATLILASSGVTGNNTSWTATYTYSIVDASGNAAANAVVVYTGGDTQAPSLSGSLPGGAQGNVCLSAAPTAPANATIAALYTDNCSAVTATLILASSGVTGNNTSWTATYTYSIVDASGNAAANAVVVYTGGDTQAPSLSGSLPGGAQGNVCLSAAPTAPANATIAAQYTDNCSAVTATLILASSGVTGNNTSWTATYTYSIVDASGNAAANAVVVYTGGDIAPPVIMGSITNTNVEGCSSANAPAAKTSVAALEGLTGNLAISDNCTADGFLAVSHNDVVTGTCPIQITRTYTINDGNGNSSTVDHIIYVDDNTLPTAITQNINVTIGVGGTATITPAQVNNGSSDNCSAVTLSLDKTIFDCDDIGANTVTLTVKDACLNEKTATATVTVNASTVTTARVSAPSVRYQDEVTLYAEIETGCAAGLEGTVEFFLDGVSVGTAPAYPIPLGEVGYPNTLRATLVHKVIQLPKTNYATTPWVVKAVFTPNSITSPGILGSEDVENLIINPRQATYLGDGFYTGDVFVWTPTETSSTGTVLLSAVIKDGNSPLGDVRGARVTFYYVVNGGYTPIPSATNLPVNLVNLTDGTVGVASATVQLNIGNQNSASYMIAIGISGGYINRKTDPEALDMITVSKAVPGGYICGGGNIKNGSSTAGFIRGAMDQLTSFSLDVKFTNKLTNPQGKVNNIIVKSYYKPDGTLDNKIHTYLVNSTAISVFTVGKPANGDATFTSKANLMEMFEGYTVSIEGGINLQLTMTDKGAGTLDVIGITLYRKAGGIWFSTKWNGTKTDNQVLVDGNIYVSTSGLPQNSSVTRTIIDNPITEVNRPLALKALPNPSTSYFTVQISGNENERAQMVVSDVTGRTIEIRDVVPGQSVQVGNRFKPGVYFVEVIQGIERKQLKLVKM